eukprot:CCRYP_017554-RA/>CCRYP_017554-RA protein AED:0.49 eAED:0.49 QI:0/0/0/1/0/0/2/0/61
MTYLNDSMVNFCLKYLKAHDNRSIKANHLKIWNELKMDKEVEIFKKSMLVFPINGKLHWST